MKAGIVLALCVLIPAVAMTSGASAAQATRPPPVTHCTGPLPPSELQAAIIDLMPAPGGRFSSDDLVAAILRHNRTSLRPITLPDGPNPCLDQDEYINADVWPDGHIHMMGWIGDETCVERKGSCPAKSDLGRRLASPAWKTEEVCYVQEESSSVRVIRATAPGKQSIFIVGVYSRGSIGGWTWLELHPLKDFAKVCGPISAY